MILGVVIRHEVVVEVVIAAHPNKENGVSQSLTHILRTKIAFDLLKSALEVLDLLVERDTTDLHDSSRIYITKNRQYWIWNLVVKKNCRYLQNSGLYHQEYQQQQMHS